jgi:hypothetical protein
MGQGIGADPSKIFTPGPGEEIIQIGQRRNIETKDEKYLITHSR